MADILGPVLARQLQEKLYDRRKQAALEVERLVREALLQNNSLRVTDLIRCIVDFAYSPAANARNGGLIALAAVAIALGNTLANHLNTIVPPILACFSDPDIRVRYYACESMYNVAKVARRDLLMFFNEIFDALSRLVADQDGSVKNGAELLDRLIKDIVCEHAEFVSANWINNINQTNTNTTNNHNNKPLPSEPSFPAAPGSTPLFPADALATTFNFPRFIPLLSERIKTVNPFTRMFLIQWILTLDAIPLLELVAFLPDFLDGLFLYLSDSNLDVRTAALNLLQEFLREISQSTHHHHQNHHGHHHHHHQIVGGKNSSSSLYSQMSRGASEENQRRRSTSTTIATENVGGAIAENDNSLAPPNLHQSFHKSTSSPDFEEEPVISRPISSLSLASAFFADTRGKPTATTAAMKTTIINNLASAVGAPKSYNTSSYPNNSTLIQNLDFSKIIKILLPYLSSNDSETQATALRWIHEFVQTVPAKVIVAFTPGLVGAILPCLSQVRVTPIKHMAIDVNAGLYRLVAEYAVVSVGGGGGSEGVGNSGKGSSMSLGGGGAPLSESFDIAGAVESLTCQFRNEHEETRVASMDWLLMLHKKAPKRVVDSEDVLFQSLLKLLSDTSEEVVKKDLQLLAQISISSDEEYFHRFLVNLLDVFSMDRKLLESRGSLIIRHLCLSLNPERMFRAFAEILERDDVACLISAYFFARLYLQLVPQDLEFASTMVQNLNIILVTAPELSDLRRRLKNLDTRSSAFATLRNRLSSVSSMVMLYGVNGGSAASVLSGGGGVAGGAGVGASPAATVRSRTKAVSSASASSVPDISLKWNELLAHFRNVQNRHERSRRVGTRTGSAAGGSRRRGTAYSSSSSAGVATTATSGGNGLSPLSQNLPNRLARSVSMANSANGVSEEQHNHDNQQSNLITMTGTGEESGTWSVTGYSLQQPHHRIHQLVENNSSLSSLSLDSSNNGSVVGGGGGGDSLVVTGTERSGIDFEGRTDKRGSVTALSSSFTSSTGGIGNLPGSPSHAASGALSGGVGDGGGSGTGKAKKTTSWGLSGRK
ncbi:UNVERIFIED_CONTAM: hypothetical protein HDU68_011654 [Siphonaria sp. JEL0065]|nr:hypothetical protein HDU68_011654 [Siphonaria sp. JEL0065]